MVGCHQWVKDVNFASAAKSFQCATSISCLIFRSIIFKILEIMSSAQLCCSTNDKNFETFSTERWWLKTLMELGFSESRSVKKEVGVCDHQKGVRDYQKRRCVTIKRGVGVPLNRYHYLPLRYTCIKAYPHTCVQPKSPSLTSNNKKLIRHDLPYRFDARFQLTHSCTAILLIVTFSYNILVNNIIDSNPTANLIMRSVHSHHSLDHQTRSHHISL